MSTGAILTRGQIIGSKLNAQSQSPGHILNQGLQINWLMEQQRLTSVCSCKPHPDPVTWVLLFPSLDKALRFREKERLAEDIQVTGVGTSGASVLFTAILRREWVALFYQKGS